MDRILIPTDFSSTANNAIKAAEKIASKLNAEVLFLHTLHVPTEWITIEHYERATFPLSAETQRSIYPGMDKIEEDAKNKLQTLVDKFTALGIKASYKVVFDFTVDGILTVAKQENIDLIVMGSHGTSGISEMFLGSNTEKIIRLAPCPVLTIKHDPKGFQIKNIVFASDFSPEAEEPFKKIVAFSKLFESAVLHMVTINTKDYFITSNQAEKLMENFAKNNNLEDYTITLYNDESVEEGIMHFSNKVGADMIIMETYGRTGIAHLFSGSITEDVANHSSYPVLSIKIGEVKTREIKYPNMSYK